MWKKYNIKKKNHALNILGVKYGDKVWSQENNHIVE